MDIYTFFSQRAGLWLSQSTAYDLVSNKSYHHRTQIEVELIAPTELRMTVEKKVSFLKARPKEEGRTGHLLWQGWEGEYQGEFIISGDSILTMRLGEREEKLWFPLPNLCMRTAAVGLYHTQFWTEVRKLR
ncbi:MAG: hypothetical protein RMK91_03280 [Pseudanabaenaceae cyanobacterium SKYGB_i_bin29]|nr:hypothetical protein [Pseudanabaenaceae cyanobacterium SKYG29]MDW8420866.1 hypothetical protein [Pseudanabaenaceae cyanobacterium SKYGB_i_bin29]